MLSPEVAGVNEEKVSASTMFTSVARITQYPKTVPEPPIVPEKVHVCAAKAAVVGLPPVTVQLAPVSVLAA